MKKALLLLGAPLLISQGIMSLIKVLIHCKIMNLQKKRKWILLLAILVLLILVVILTKTCFNKPEPGGTNIPVMMPDSVIYSVDNQSGSVETQMKNVDFHIDASAPTN